MFYDQATEEFVLERSDFAETVSAVEYAAGVTGLLGGYFAKAMKWAENEGRKEADRIWREVWCNGGHREH